MIRPLHREIEAAGRHPAPHLRARVADPLRALSGASAAIARVRAQIAQVAGSSFSVLISGETGTGKEVVAAALHACSARAGAAFVAVDCAAIPESVFESELFGHRRGAFTGADADHAGVFQTAGHGTLFLDEIGNLPRACQAKLLRVLQERRLRPLGASAPVPFGARVLAASNVDLAAAIKLGQFRDDLYYRLAEFVIEMPALRERLEDIAVLAADFLAEANHDLDKAVDGLAPEAVELLMAQRWPGNVRQLRNAIRRAALLAGRRIEARHLDGLIANERCEPPARTDGEPLAVTIRRTTAAIERTALADMLEQTGGNKAAAARRLGLTYKTLLSKVHRYGLVAVRSYQRRGA